MNISMIVCDANSMLIREEPDYWLVASIIVIDTSMKLLPLSELFAMKIQEQAETSHSTSAEH